MANYKTVKRKANVGERILITNAIATNGEYSNGYVGEVKHPCAIFSELVYVKEWEHPVTFKEYEVIVEDYSQKKPSKSERITQLESKVAALEAKVEALQGGYIIGVDLAKPNSDYTRFIPKLTPNEQRKAVIERAKAFVNSDEHKDSDGHYKVPDTRGGFTSLFPWYCNVEYVINSDKRTVVALMRGWKSDDVIGKAIAKCAPDDVFNADIGKAIALGRALGLDVSEFENAVKPTEVVVGMVVRTKISTARKVVKIERNAIAVRLWRDNDMYVEEKNSVILDDTEAQY